MSVCGQVEVWLEKKKKRKKKEKKKKKTQFLKMFVLQRINSFLCFCVVNNELKYCVTLTG